MHSNAEHSAIYPFSQSVNSLTPVIEGESSTSVANSQTPVLQSHRVDFDQKRVESVSQSPLLMRKSPDGENSVNRFIEPVSPLPVIENESQVQKSKTEDAVDDQQSQNQPESKLPSLQEVMDAELAQQQTSKPSSVGPKSWADRARGGQARQVPKPKSALLQPPLQQHHQPPVSHNERDQHLQCSKQSNSKETRESKSNRGPFTGEVNDVRSGFRGGFRGGGRGRVNGGTSFRGWFHFCY